MEKWNGEKKRRRGQEEKRRREEENREERGEKGREDRKRIEKNREREKKRKRKREKEKKREREISAWFILVLFCSLLFSSLRYCARMRTRKPNQSKKPHRPSA